MRCFNYILQQLLSLCCLDLIWSQFLNWHILVWETNLVKCQQTGNDRLQTVTTLERYDLTLSSMKKGLAARRSCQCSENQLAESLFSLIDHLSVLLIFSQSSTWNYERFIPYHYRPSIIRDICWIFQGVCAVIFYLQTDICPYVTCSRNWLSSDLLLLRQVLKFQPYRCKIQTKHNRWCQSDDMLGLVTLLDSSSSDFNCFFQCYCCWLTTHLYDSCL